MSSRRAIANPTLSVEPLNFETAGQWRKWLERNHDKSEGEWVYMYKKNAATGLRYSDALDEALCFGWIDGQVFAVDAEKFRQRWTPRRPRSIWSNSNKARVKRLTAEGRMAEPGLAAVKAAKQNGRWQEAAFDNAPAMPKDLRAALRLVPQAWQNFSRFAPSYRRMYAGWIAGAKQESTRARRIQAVVQRAAHNLKPGMDSPYSIPAKPAGKNDA